MMVMAEVVLPSMMPYFNLMAMIVSVEDPVRTSSMYNVTNTTPVLDPYRVYTYTPSLLNLKITNLREHAISPELMTLFLILTTKVPLMLTLLEYTLLTTMFLELCLVWVVSHTLTRYHLKAYC